MKSGLWASLAKGAVCVLVGVAGMAQALPLTGLNGQQVVISEDISAVYINDGYYGNPSAQTLTRTVGAGAEVSGNPWLGYAAFAAMDIDPAQQVIFITIAGGCGGGCGIRQNDWIITLDFPNLAGQHFSGIQTLYANSNAANAIATIVDGNTLTLDISGLYGFYAPNFFANFGYTLAADLPVDTGGGTGSGGNTGGNDVPEPGSLALLGLGLAGLALRHRRRQNA